jgi:molecular chaperone DnaK (HSP70)
LAPERLERTPKRILDQNAVLLGDTQLPASTLVARVLAHAAAETARLFDDARPQATVVTFPASWASMRRRLLQQAAADTGLKGVWMLAEPVAAAMHFATEVPDGAHVAVFDLGGGQLGCHRAALQLGGV